METLIHWISQYGYFGIFGLLVVGIVGLPVPDETLLVFCGTLVAKGDLTLLGAGLSALAGSMGGTTASYLIGRLAGYEFIHRFGRYIHFTEERQAQAKQWFDRMGHWLLTIGYFIPGVRHFTALSAGISGLPYRTFAAYAYPGALVWISVFIGLGYFLGDNWLKILDSVHRWILLILSVAAAGAFGIYFYRRRMKGASRDSKQ